MEVDFSYTPSDPETGQEFYIEGDCYYFLKTEWVYDGYTWVDPDIPPPQPTGEWTYDVQPISGDNTGAIFSIDILPRSGAFEGGPSVSGYIISRMVATQTGGKATI